MLGAAAVGKTSLVRQFVHGIFSDEYVTTIGVKIQKKTVEVDGRAVHLLLWDINGEDRFQRVSGSYIRGTAAYLLVADGTRPQTLETARLLHERARDTVGDVPFRMLINKADLRGQHAPETEAARWSVTEDTLEHHHMADWPVLYTSAKSGLHVDDAFAALARALAVS